MAQDNPKGEGFGTRPGRGWSAGSHRPPATRGWPLSREGRHMGAADCPRPRPGHTLRKRGSWYLKGPGSQRKWSARRGKAPGGEGLDSPRPALSRPGPRGAPHLPSQNQLRAGGGVGGRRPGARPALAARGHRGNYTLRCRRLPARPRIPLPAPLSSPPLPSSAELLAPSYRALPGIAAEANCLWGPPEVSRTPRAPRPVAGTIPPHPATHPTRATAQEEAVMVPKV